MYKKYMDFKEISDVCCLALRTKFGRRRELILSRKFIIENMNEITKKLLGLSEDELSTSKPTRDKHGIYMILYILHVEFDDFTKFIKFLKIKYMKEEDFDSVMNVSTILGGYDCVDNYIKKFYEDNKENPRCPKDDHKSEYDWIDVPIGTLPHSREDVRKYLDRGYSSTQYILEKSESEYPIVYYRKKKGFPKSPEEDTKDMFLWKVVRICRGDTDHETLDANIAEGYTLTNQKINLNSSMMYMRKPK